MYIPNHFAAHDRTLVAEAIEAYPFATLVSPYAERPFATHCPLVLDARGEIWHLEGHLAKANPHWQSWTDEGAAVLAIFHGPQAYVSPSFYGQRNSVPTWNYVAVHVYGRVHAVFEADAKEAILKRLIARTEPAYAAQWDSLDAEFQSKLLAGIVGFRVEVEQCEAKFKLSQNRPAEDRARIAAAFSDGDCDERALARWMERLGIG